MKKTLLQSHLGDDKFRFSVKLEGAECPPLGVESRIRAMELLRALTTNPGLTDCGNNHFETMRMFHDGKSWVIELEAVGT